MAESRFTDRRGKDVLFALAVSSSSKQQLGRLALQKFIYLFDVLALACREVGGSKAFRPWRNGPYDFAIQNTVDALAFRGFVSISNLSFRRTKNTECNYTLTEAGKTVVAQFKKDKAFYNDFSLFEEIALEINRRGWKNIKNIVYSEPTYRFARSNFQGNELALNSQDANLSWQLLNDLRKSFEVTRDKPMSRRTLVQVFFALLDEYATTPDSKFEEQS